MPTQNDDDAAILAASGLPAPTPEALPVGILPKRSMIDAWGTLGWVAWRTVTWTPIEAMPPGPEREEKQADLERAHAELVEAFAASRGTAVACRPAAYAVGDGCPSVMIAPAGVAEPVPPAVFATPGLRIESHGHVTLRYRPRYEPDGGAELPLYVAIRFPTVALADCWPPPAGPKVRKAPSQSVQAAYARFVTGHIKAGTQPTVADTRAAMLAVFPDHAPLTDRALGKLRASKTTPPAWHKPGRPRRKSSRGRETKGCN